MSNPLPNNLALSVINTNDPINSAPLRNDFASVQVAVNQLISCLAGGTANQLLQAVDGTDVQWATPAGVLIALGSKTANVTTSGTTFGTGVDLLASALSFTADGSHSYLVTVSAVLWSNSIGGDENLLNLNLDGVDAGQFAACFGSATLFARGVVTPTAGTHTINARYFVGAGGGTGTIFAGAGGTGVSTPAIVTVERAP